MQSKVKSKNQAGKAVLVLTEAVLVYALLLAIVALIASGCAAIGDISHNVEGMAKHAAAIDAKIDRAVEQVRAQVEAESERCRTLHPDDDDQWFACLLPTLEQAKQVEQTLRKAVFLQQFLPELLKELDRLAADLRDVERRFAD